MPFQHLDLVAVRILHEEKARHETAVAVELLHVVRLEALLDETPMLGPGVVDADRDVAVAVAVGVGLRSGPC